MQSALQAAHRLRKQRIYLGTLEHWEGLLKEANRSLDETVMPDDQTVRALAVELEAVLVARRLAAGRPTRPPLPS